MREKMKKKSFWLAVIGAVVLALQLLGVKVNLPHVNEVVSAVCALLILLGLITDDTKPAKEECESSETEESSDIKEE